jgi:carbonic anhydrase/acetyltransferase-like protein (isoleucine patch superfamily)
LIHKPKEGIFLAEVGNPDYDFWMFRTELKKIALWLLRNSPLPWMDAIALKWFGVKMDFSSHLNDAWCDAEFVKLGRKNLVGQGATLMSSMVVGKYLIIKPIVFDDYIMVGGHTTIAPGVVMGHDSVVGAISSTTYSQILKSNCIYFGIPARFLKENKYAEERRDIVVKRHVDESKKLEETHEVNIDEDKKKYVKTGDDE